MITVRPAAARGHFDFGWLDTFHTFSFGDYYDPSHMGFRALRVINDDRVAPARGFGSHPHRDMEIVTVVLEGQLEHKDSLGTGSVIHPGEVQRMSAGTGIVHSEMNPSQTKPVHLLQIWIQPNQQGLAPSYEQKAFPDHERRGRLRLVASEDGREGSLHVHQDVAIYVASLDPASHVSHALAPGRHAWVQIARGSLDLDGHRLLAGDGAAVSDARAIGFSGTTEAEIVLFDLA